MFRTDRDRARLLRLGLAATLSCCACTGAPLPRSDAAQRAAGEPNQIKVDPCRNEAGKPPPAALARAYQGLLATARCVAEVDVMMQEVSAALGVRCDYCHVGTDYARETEKSRIANFMATELVPRLDAKDHTEVTCVRCHRGVAKILGAPRSEPRALEWMTAELSPNFVTKDDRPLRCKSCHGADWGTPGFHRTVILTHELDGLPRAAAKSP
ncbi:MAG TPA: hypothetical protein VFQ35_01650 [Polyangiaceae bacterium]|nr:hypothetical protein [Polyangiaceae bacterium]